MQDIIKTNDSSLKIGYFKDLDLIDKCISDIQDKLVCNTCS